MGRKIPGKKHRGVKDPEKQRNTRLKSLKGKVNVPPSDPDFQEVPRSVNRIAELKQLTIHSNKSKRSKNKLPFKQRKGESDKQFLYRIQKACDAVIQENAFENKYGVDIKRNPETGEVERLLKRKKDELEELVKKANKDAKGGKSKKRKAETAEPHLTKSQKRQRKLTERKQKKAARKDWDVHKDVVKFGEVVHAPPTLSAPKRVAKSNCAPRPGQKNLLLKSIIQNPEDNSPKNQKQVVYKDKLRKTANKTIDKTGKRKNLPNALRRRLEKQQTEIINAYRMLKKQKNASGAV